MGAERKNLNFDKIKGKTMKRRCNQKKHLLKKYENIKQYKKLVERIKKSTHIYPFKLNILQDEEVLKMLKYVVDVKRNNYDNTCYIECKRYSKRNEYGEHAYILPSRKVFLYDPRMCCIRFIG